MSLLVASSYHAASPAMLASERASRPVIAGGAPNIAAWLSAALAPELSRDYHLRTRLFAVRTYFGTISGGLMIVLLNVVFLRRDATHPLGVLNRGPEANALAQAEALGVLAQELVDLGVVREVRVTFVHREVGEADRVLRRVDVQ